MPGPSSEPLGSGFARNPELSSGKFAMKSLNLPLRGLCLAAIDLAWAFGSNRSELWFPMPMSMSEPIGGTEPVIVCFFQVCSFAKLEFFGIYLSLTWIDGRDLLMKLVSMATFAGVGLRNYFPLQPAKFTYDCPSSLLNPMIPLLAWSGLVECCHFLPPNFGSSATRGVSSPNSSDCF